MSKRFVGTFLHQVDEKFRFRLPTKLKDKLTSGAFLHGGVHGQLILIPEDDYDEIYNKAYGDISVDESNLDSNQKKRMQQERIFSSKSMELVEDKHGRYTLTADLVEFAKINKNLITIGRNSVAEIWAEEVFNDYINRDDL